ncbi:peptidase MA family metallohydrolase [Tautonia rosea]|uniref:peptidase MA family metallohydrolase n=1 Tax=Tautonia rosea TaxID=2728037 RepID=UPI001472FD87|nr:hypothetical protein [Tautonia rosea]
MHRLNAPTAALMAAALLSLSAAITHAQAADPPEELKAGREALSRGDGPAAVTLLESALLAVASADREAVLDDLRRAYERAAAQAEAAGDTRRARQYRENLLIINRSRRTSDPSTTTPSDEAASSDLSETTAPSPKPEAPLDSPESPPPAPSEEQPKPILEIEEPTIVAQPAPIAQSSALEPSAAATLNLQRENVASEAEPIAIDPGPSPESSTSPPGGQTLSDVLRSADAAFRSQKYDDAGRVYAMLAQRGQLPESHKPVWAYCRFVAVARRINAQPSTPAEWSAIHAEIREVRALAPEIWFSEYLRRLATERSAAVGARPSSFIVRGQSESSETTKSAPSSWQILETENFRIFHVDPTLANQLARRVENARDQLYHYWNLSALARSWSPRCDLYVYPNASIYARMTGQPADSPGFSTLDLSRGRVVSRRINLRADADRLLDAVAPHEVSHVVLADLFPGQQIPRWADEGMAILAEPIDAQEARLANLDLSLSSGRVFRTGAMMGASSPRERDWDLFMAQSTSLTQYFIQLDSPKRFLIFLRESQRLGTESALKTVYGIESTDELHSRWLAHARRTARTTSDERVATHQNRTPRD